MAAHRLTAAKVRRELEKHKGNVSAVARACGVYRNAVYEFMRRRPDLMQVWQDAREEMADNGESALGVSVINREAWAVQFVLKTIGKNRGYVERSEVTGADGADLFPVKEVIVEHHKPSDAAGSAAPEQPTPGTG